MAAVPGSEFDEVAIVDPKVRKQLFEYAILAALRMNVALPGNERRLGPKVDDVEEERLRHEVPTIVLRSHARWGEANPVARRLLRRTLYATRAAGVARVPAPGTPPHFSHPGAGGASPRRECKRVCAWDTAGSRMEAASWIMTSSHCWLARSASTYLWKRAPIVANSVAAVRDIFAHLISVELSPELAAAARSRFAGDPAVRILEGDFAAGLGEALEAHLIARPFFGSMPIIVEDLRRKAIATRPSRQRLSRSFPTAMDGT